MTVATVLADLQQALTDARAVSPAIPVVIADLQKALTDAQSLLPPPSSFPQYYLDDSGWGPSSTNWNTELFTPWPAYLANKAWKFGNWLDANDVSQGPSPYCMLMVPKAVPLNAYFDNDVTPVAAKWLRSAQNRGIYFGQAAFIGMLTVAGRLSANPPLLLVETDTGAFTLSGTIGGWNTSSTIPIDTRQSAHISKGVVTLLHFDLSFVTGALQSATLRLYALANTATAAFSVPVMQTDAPYCPVGGDGENPVLGLAAQIGEENLPGNPQVFVAGDFHESNWVVAKDGNGNTYANRLMPSPIGTFNNIATSIPGFQLEFDDDPDYPGRQYMRASMVHGNGDIAATSSLSFRGEYATLPQMTAANPARAPDPATILEEIYVRSYMMLEEDFWTTVDGIKGGIGIDARMGYWSDVNKGYWQATTGNSGSKGTGLKVMSKAIPGHYEYQGHSIRQHWDLCRPTGTPLQNFRPIIVMVSHLGPFDWTPYGTEEERRCGTVVVEKGKKFCVEWHMKMNSIDLTAVDALGNGTANHDGTLELWVDGVHRWAKTDFAWRRTPEMGITGHWILWMHGGIVPAAVGEAMHYRHYDFCAARTYIGPRR